jgi:protein-tyrosine phosphatase
MFSLFKKKEVNPQFAGVLPVSTDMHSHILPGIDDGSPDLETSLELVKGLYDLGIRKAIATPHIIGDLYRNTPETINNALNKLKDACKREKINIQLSAAAEYMIDDYFLGLLKNKEKLLTLHKNILLTEISYATPPVNLAAITNNILAEGYKPVLAHPERYFFYHKTPDQYYKLREMGFLLQVNLLSLTGYYGTGVKKAAKFLLDKGLVSLVGTDMHHHYHLNALADPKNLSIINEYARGKVSNDLNMFA